MRSNCRNRSFIGAVLAMLLSVCLYSGSVFATVYSATSYELGKRKFIVETIALVVAVQLDDNTENYAHLRDSLQSIVQGVDDVQSAAVRFSSPVSLTISSGQHAEYWTLTANQKSSPTQIQVPLFDGTQQIATVEIRFVKPDIEGEIPRHYDYANILALCITNDLLADSFFDLLPRLGLLKRSLASCCEMVLPPPELSLENKTVFKATRTNARKSMPLCLWYLRSSVLSKAL